MMNSYSYSSTLTLTCINSGPVLMIWDIAVNEIGKGHAYKKLTDSQGSACYKKGVGGFKRLECYKEFI